MISSLSDLKIHELANEKTATSGMDNLNSCLYRPHYVNFPYEVYYHYNSRGFRDSEWPEVLDDVIWCIGDSFTSGVGSPLPHTWVNILQRYTKRRCINISLDGASNAWISRRACQIINSVSPTNVVIHWSYLNRGEDNDLSKSDYRRRLHYHKKTLRSSHLMIEDFELCVNNVVSAAKDYSTNVVFSVIPKFAWMLESESGSKLENILNKTNTIPEFEILDYARDSHHYDVLTATEFVKNIIPRLR